MAIGNEIGSSTNQQKKMYDQSFYARQSYKSNDDKMNLSIEYKGGKMLLKLSEVKEGFHYDEKIAIHISPMKANILSKQLMLYKEKLAEEKLKPQEAYGVNAGMGEKITYINFFSPDNKAIAFEIGKFDGNGIKTESYQFQFKDNYHYGLNWKDNSKNDLSKNYYDKEEFSILCNAIADFGRYMNGASAYSVWDLGRYETGRILSKMDPIYDKLGIERRTGGSGSFNKGTNSFLNNTGGTSSSTSFDSIEAMMDDD